MADRQRRPPRTQGEGGLTHRKDGRWEGTYYDATGKRQSVYAKTRREAAVRLTEAITAVRAGLNVKPTRETFGQYLERWLRDVKAPEVSPVTLAGYEYRVRRYIVPTLGRLPLRQVQAALIQALYTHLRGQGLGAKSIRHVHVILRMALGQALLWNLVVRNEALGAKPDKPTTKFRGNPLTAEEARKLLVASADNPLMHAVIALGLDSGMGPGEMYALTWKNVDLDRKPLAAVQVTQALASRGPKLPKDTKNEFRRRSILINKDTVAALRVWRQRQRVERLAAGEQWSERGYVFTNLIGNALDNSRITRRYHALLTHAEIAVRRLYDLRHTMATLMLLAGIHPKVVQERLGHSSILMTLNTYSHVLPSLQEDATPLLWSILWGSKTGNSSDDPSTDPSTPAEGPDLLRLVNDDD